MNRRPPNAASARLPPCAGIGLRACHHAEVRERRPAAGWFEVHSENFFAAGGETLRLLEDLRADYPLSLHGVGLSLGSGEAGDRHLARLKALVERIDPAAVSEHLCWSAVAGRHYNDLLPLPYTEEALAVVCARIDEVQTALRRPILVENVSSYVEFAGSTIPEWEFVAAVARRSGCGLLLDVNNLYVSARNHGFDPQTYLAAIPPAAVGEIHLAGYDECDDFLVDSHGRAVQPPVWALYEAALARLGARSTLIEWDTDIPPLAVLLGEAAKADARLEAQHALAARALRDTQRAFAAALTGGGDAESPLLDRIAGPREAAARRFAAYRRNVRGNWIGALRSTHPVVAATLGEPAFDRLAGDYAQDHASPSGDLNDYGEDFADFLAARPEAAVRPWLPDLARLERALQTAYYAADATPFDFAALAAVPPEMHGALRFRLAPAYRALASDWPLATLWQAGESGLPIANPCRGEHHVWIVRPRGRVWAEAAGAGEAAFIAALADGAELAAAIAAALARDADFAVAATLARAAALGIVAGFYLTGEAQ